VDPPTPHLRTCAHYLGVAETHRVDIEYQEFGDERHRRSIDQAHAEVLRLVEQLVSCPATKAA
jgi:FMN-dependent NADH-azoreductase